jgi:outer membrane protein assembly factor BamB
MKVRVLLLVVGVLATFGTAGYVAWQLPWVRSFFQRDSVDQEELDRARKEKPQNVAPPEAASGSPQWRGASGLGVAPAGSFRTDWDKNPPRELWRVSIGGGYGSCSVVGGKVYVQDREGGKDRITCLDAETGKVLWANAHDARPPGNDPTFAIGPRATPAVVGDWVYTVGGDGQLMGYEVQANNMLNIRWHHDLLAEFGAPMPQWGVACSPLVLGDLVIVQPGGKQGAVVAFDRVSGELKWKAGSNGPGYSSPTVGVIDGEPTVFAFMGDSLLAIRPTDGKLLSISRDKGRKVDTAYPWPTQHSGNIATPIVNGNYVFISSAYGGGCALLRGEKKDGEVRLVEVYAKRRSGFQNHHATSVYKDGYLFGVDGTKGASGLKCIRFEDGEEVEDWGGARIGQSSLLLAGDYLIIQTERGELCLVEANPKEFKQVAKTPKVLSGNNNWASPTLVDGRIYLRDEKNVVCLDVRP